MLFWKNGGGDRNIYDLFAANLNVVDEYFVEHVHSVIWRQTKASDSDEQVREKVHGIFASSESQTNWRSNFTPSKNSVFSRQQLTSLYCKAATVITNVLIEIALNVNTATVLPRQPGQRKDCSLWLLPNLFEEKSIKSYILPLGYNFHPQPEFSKRCDSPSCNVSSDLPWKLFEGCWHSFHLECLRGMTICVICRDGLQKNLQSLSKIANEAFVRGVPLVPEGECWEEAIHEEDTDATADDDHEIPAIGELNVDQIIQGLTRQILNIQVNQPSIGPVSITIQPSITPVLHGQTNQSTTVRKPCHCTLCHHIYQGHQQQQTNQKGERVVHCLYCPNKVCCRGGGGVNCSCHWCEKHTVHSTRIPCPWLQATRTLGQQLFFRINRGT